MSFKSKLVIDPEEIFRKFDFEKEDTRLCLVCDCYTRYITFNLFLCLLPTKYQSLRTYFCPLGLGSLDIWGCRAERSYAILCGSWPYLLQSCILHSVCTFFWKYFLSIILFSMYGFFLTEQGNVAYGHHWQHQMSKLIVYNPSL